MPDIDRNEDIRVYHDPDSVTAEIPPAGHAGERCLLFFRKLASKSRQEPVPEAHDRKDRTWITVRVPDASSGVKPEVWLDAVSALIREVNAMEQQSQSGAAQTEAAIRSWWASQQR